MRDGPVHPRHEDLGSRYAASAISRNVRPGLQNPDVVMDLRVGEGVESPLLSLGGAPRRR